MGAVRGLSVDINYRGIELKIREGKGKKVNREVNKSRGN